MTSPPEAPSEPRHPPIVADSGTAPGDRQFRPDVEGLRAVAVLLVVFYHAGLGGLSGGFVGVDVFFVISGFVITGLLLRERATSNGVSLLRFYGRRCRRIIPAATVVIIVTVVATYSVLGVIYGNQTAIDARWTAVFLANFHFASVGTNYLAMQHPPSPLLNFWSLAVEEQFYLVYPAIFLLASTARIRWSLQVRLVIALGVIFVLSFALSVFQTNSDPTVAYFSPFTRAWELALGALVAVGTNWLLRIPRSVGCVMTWGGLAAIAGSALIFNSHTPYPGSLVAVPVVGASLVIAGGITTPRWAAESLLGLPPFRWFGRLSYSIYLWHWPILVLAAESVGRSSLPFRQNVVWLLAALAASVVTYRLVENPIRHASLAPFKRWAPIALGVALVATSLVVATVEFAAHSNGARITQKSNAAAAKRAIESFISSIPESNASVERLVRSARSIRTLPSDLTPSLVDAPSDWGGPGGGCWPSLAQSTVTSCLYGDLHSTHTMVLYGDSHAAMWFSAFKLIATSAHWKLAILGKGDCPADMLSYENPPGYGSTGGEYTPCDRWHQFALNRIRQLKPDLVVITQEFRTRPDGKDYSAGQWQKGLESTFAQLHVPAKDIVVLGNIPSLPESGPQCLSQHSNDVQACSAPLARYFVPFNRAERAAASAAGARYLNVLPWFCSTTCTAVIDKYEVYFDDYHITFTYSLRLAGVLSQALHLGPIR